MRTVLRHRAALVYVLLVVATAVAWGMAEGRAASTKVTAFVVIIAAIKQRAVMLHFMELRHAPIVWRCIVEAFVAVPAAGVLYCFSLAGM